MSAKLAPFRTGVVVSKMSGTNKPLNTPWKDLIKKSNIHKKTKTSTSNEDANIGIRQEWRHFRPKEKVFILKAIHTCTSAKDVGEVLTDYVNAADHINKDRDFLIACLAACLQSKMTLGTKFKAVFRDVCFFLVSFSLFGFTVGINLHICTPFFMPMTLRPGKQSNFLLAHQVHGRKHQG